MLFLCWFISSLLRVFWDCRNRRKGRKTASVRVEELSMFPRFYCACSEPKVSESCSLKSLGNIDSSSTLMDAVFLFYALFLKVSEYFLHFILHVVFFVAACHNEAADFVEISYFDTGVACDSFFLQFIIFAQE